MGLIKRRSAPDGALAKFVYYIRLLAGCAVTLPPYVLGVILGLLFLLALAALLVLAAIVGFVLLVIWSIGLGISPHTINTDHT